LRLRSWLSDLYAADVEKLDDDDQKQDRNMASEIAAPSLKRPVPMPI